MTAPRTPGVATAVIAAALDAILIVLFALAGRGSHAEALDLVGVLGTAWPFLAGAAIGWLAVRAWRRPLATWPTGVGVWAGALVVGMALRALTGQGVALAFVIVATLTLALFLIGWRALAALGSALRTRRRARAVAH
ncbi:DUF3054 domain-containing protein [Agromyces aurantiacus]|uniref:DUF3054 domain-containing protein n=1 Tax=Agromyces aurantiacus TaxID=165814 RepID=A0ABV9RF53_9MICO|nr:DUF3054 domain-containing protein [Agromyces aurantiacus]MBM7505463.1 peptidoglycan/LPS O-acetylase OafA/YrhL [Agromyces aurantiacus]